MRGLKDLLAFCIHTTVSLFVHKRKIRLFAGFSRSGRITLQLINQNDTKEATCCIGAVSVTSHCLCLHLKLWQESPSSLMDVLAQHRQFWIFCTSFIDVDL